MDVRSRATGRGRRTSPISRARHPSRTSTAGRGPAARRSRRSASRGRRRRGRSSTSPTCSSALGVTRFCIHTSPHQPIAAPPPGIALAPFLGPGVHGQRDVGGHGPSVDRLPRPLQRAAERGPAGGRRRGLRRRGGAGHRPVRRRARYGGAGRVRLRLRRARMRSPTILRVEDGRVRSVGADYRLLLSRRVEPAHDARGADRASSGCWMPVPPSSVAGRSPRRRSPMTPRCSASVCDRIWGAGRTGGRVVATATSTMRIRELGMRPALEIDGGAVRRIARVVDGRAADVPREPVGASRCTLRVTPVDGSGALVGWDPVELRTTRRAGRDDAVGIRCRSRSPCRRSARSSCSPRTTMPAPEACRAPVPLRRRVALAAAGRANRWSMTPAARAVDRSRRRRRAASRAPATYRTSFALTRRQPSADRVRRGARRVRRHRPGARQRAWTAASRGRRRSASTSRRRCARAATASRSRSPTPWRNRLIAEAGVADRRDLRADDRRCSSRRPTVRPAGLSGPVWLLVERLTPDVRTSTRISCPYCRT